MTSALLASIVLAPLLILALGGPSPAHAARPDLPDRLRQVPPARWERLGAARIYFGHNSVGADILRGVARLRSASPGIVPPLVDFSGPLTESGLTHGLIGENTRPLTKLEGFKRALAGGVGTSADWAMFKFCYVDLTAGSDADALFASYRQAMAELRRTWPVTFIHVTMPLTSPQTGPKAWVKTLLGKNLRGFADNASRQRFNDLMRAEYRGREPLFDLAAVQSSRPDGSRVLVEHDGRRVEALNPAFTDDGGHLNDAGAEFVASHFLLFLAGLDADGDQLDARPARATLQ